MRFRRGWLLLVASAVVAGACDTGDTAETATAVVSSSTWSRLPHDEAVFSGPERLAMSSVAVGGPGLVAVGAAGPFDDLDAAVWTSPDGVIWFRVPHDEAVFGGEGSQGMNSVTAGGPGLVAVGWNWSGRQS